MLRLSSTLLLGCLILLAAAPQARAFDPVMNSVFPIGVVYPEFVRASTLNPAGQANQQAYALEAESGLPVNLQPLWNPNNFPFSASIAAGFKHLGIGVDFEGTANTGGGASGLGTSSLSVGVAFKVDSFRAGLGLRYPVTVTPGFAGLSSTPYFSLGTIIGGKKGINGAIVVENFTGNPMTSNFDLGLGFSAGDHTVELEADVKTPALSNFISSGYSLEIGVATYFWRIGLAATAAYSFATPGSSPVGYNYAPSGFSFGGGFVFWILKGFNFQLRYKLPQTTIGLEYAFGG